ncbi:MAG TPA: choice-of-anchor Q domain-containing protein [Pyrinomonadaceae bacterium]|jgi:hypothetical protein
MKREIIIAILFLGLILSGGFFAPEASAAIFTVTNNADSGAGSFRQAVLAANSAGTNDTIEFAPALSGATITLASEIFLGGTGTLTINGLGANRLIIDGGTGNNRLFQTGGTVTIRGVTLQNGGGPGFSDVGSAVRGNFGTIVLDGVIVQNNQSNAVYFQLGSNHVISNSTIANNTADSCAGVRADRTSVTITNTTFSGNNSTSSAGGGLCIWDASTATIRNSTIANNNANGAGGQGGGGMQIFSSTVTFGNTIIAGNTSPTGPDIHRFSGTVQTTGGNLIGNNSTVSGAFPAGAPNGNGDKVNVAALLLPLGNYGGTTLTRALLSTSPAINAGNNVAGTPPTDQRGAARSGAVDSGAFENNSEAFFTLPPGTVNQPYNYTLTTNSGTLAYSLSGGSLPNGLSFSSNLAPNAVISIAGTPTLANNFNFAVTTSDGVNSSVANYTLQILPAPTAANVLVAGRILTPDGRGLINARVILTDAGGSSRTVSSTSFGYYRFEDVRAGEVYILSVSSKRYLFTPQALTVMEDISELNFNALP